MKDEPGTVNSPHIIGFAPPLEVTFAQGVDDDWRVKIHRPLLDLRPDEVIRYIHTSLYPQD